MNKIEKYVGCVVRLNKAAFDKIKEKADQSGAFVENYFLVASVSKQMRKLVCYGWNMRLTVPLSDVVLV